VKLAYLGPPGTNAEEAATYYLGPAEGTLLPFLSIPAVVEAVETTMADEGVVPIENSLEGSVPVTLDLLIHESSLAIRREIVLPIRHFLLAKPGTSVVDMRVLFSHPQALAQSRRFVDRCLPKVEVVAALSNAAAVEEMMQYQGQKSAAAIGTLRAGEIYGAEVLASDIQDKASNLTRFVVLASHDSPPTGDDKTSLCFSVHQNQPGALVEVLNEFARADVNLAKVESRPTKETFGQYIFLIDLEGHREDDQVRPVLERVRQKTDLFKIFGSYPRFRG
jgi:prephenate dehydratase